MHAAARGRESQPQEGSELWHCQDGTCSKLGHGTVALWCAMSALPSVKSSSVSHALDGMSEARRRITASATMVRQPGTTMRTASVCRVCRTESVAEAKCSWIGLGLGPRLGLRLGLEVGVGVRVRAKALAMMR